MTEEELLRTYRAAALAAATSRDETWRDGLLAVRKLSEEIRRLRAELASERTKHQELWQLVDTELDRIYCDLKGIER